MLELDKRTIELLCPLCNFYNVATLKDFRLRSAVICRGCKCTIRFEDHMSEIHKFVKSVNRMIRAWEKQFSGVRKFTIRL